MHENILIELHTVFTHTTVSSVYVEQGQS